MYAYVELSSIVGAKTKDESQAWQGIQILHLDALVSEINQQKIINTRVYIHDSTCIHNSICIYICMCVCVQSINTSSISYTYHLHDIIPSGSVLEWSRDHHGSPPSMALHRPAASAARPREAPRASWTGKSWTSCKKMMKVMRQRWGTLW